MFFSSTRILSRVTNCTKKNRYEMKSKKYNISQVERTTFRCKQCPKTRLLHPQRHNIGRCHLGRWTWPSTTRRCRRRHFGFTGRLQMAHPSSTNTRFPWQAIDDSLLSRGIAKTIPSGTSRTSSPARPTKLLSKLSRAKSLVGLLAKMSRFVSILSLLIRVYSLVAQLGQNFKQTFALIKKNTAC